MEYSNKLPAGLAYTTVGSMAVGRKLYFPAEAMRVDNEGHGYIDPYESAVGRFGESQSDSQDKPRIIVERLEEGYRVYLSARKNHLWKRTPPPDGEWLRVGGFAEEAPGSPDPASV